MKPRQRRLNKAVTPIAFERRPINPKSKKSPGVGWRTPETPTRGGIENESPLKQEILLLPPKTPYFSFQQRPTLLMDAMAREGWKVNWIAPDKMTPGPGEHKEENVIFWGSGEEDIPLSMDNILKWIISPAVRPGMNGTGLGGLWLFDYLDDFHEHRAPAENVMKAVDLVFCSADILVERARRIKGDDVYLIPNGVDLRPYREEIRDPEILYRGVPKPRIGYMGALAPWVNWNLVEQTAIAHPDWSIVIIGFFYNMGAVPFKRSLPNVYLFGAVPYHELPLHLQGLDVGIIPFRHGSIADACNPCKLYQYWAAGIPAVATKMQEVAKHKAPVAYTTTDRRSFIEAIEEALTKDCEAECRLEAENNSWDKRAQRATEILSSYYTDHGWKLVGETMRAWYKSTY